jgi:hypothetical protein
MYDRFTKDRIEDLIPEADESREYNADDVVDAAIAAAFDDPEPPCSCTQTDVDQFDESYCELCNPQSEYNRHQRALLRRDEAFRRLFIPPQAVAVDEDVAF